MTDVLAFLAVCAVIVALVLGMIHSQKSNEEKRRLNPPTKCVLGYTMIRVGSNWVYQLADNKQVPCT